MSKLLIVVFGLKGSGKDTFSDMLAEELSRGCQDTKGIPRRTSFATPLKTAALHLLGIPLEVSNGSQEQKETTRFYGKTVRHWLQWIGTEVGRQQVSPNIWVDRLCDLVERASEDVVIVSDGRFRNELTGPRDRWSLPPCYEGTTGRFPVVVNVLIRRPTSVVPVPGPDAHASEREPHLLAQEHDASEPGLFDYSIENREGLASLREQAKDLALVLKEFLK